MYSCVKPSVHGPTVSLVIEVPQAGYTKTMMLSYRINASRKSRKGLGRKRLLNRSSFNSLLYTMHTLFETRLISISIARNPREVYDFVSNPANLPRWASGIGTSIANVNGGWIAQTPQGPVKVRFAPRNDLGVLDHYVTLPTGVKIYIPLRVIPNGIGSELQFTLFRQPDMTDRKFQEDAEWVLRDLTKLKEALEKNP